MKTKILALSVSLLASSLLQAPDVFGASEIPNIISADAYVDLEWENLTVTGALTPYSDFYYSQSQAGTGAFWYAGTLPAESTWQTDYKNPGHDTYAVSSIWGGEYDTALAEGVTDATYLGSGSNVMLSSGDFGDYSAWSRAVKGQAYAVTAGGGVTFSIPYYVGLDTEGSDGSDEYAAAWAWSWLRLWNGSDWDVIDGTYVDATSNGSGYLTISYAAVAGTYLLFDAGADTIASITNPVPVPPSVLMLLTGCTSLFFLKRRKS